MLETVLNSVNNQSVLTFVLMELTVQWGENNFTTKYIIIGLSKEKQCH